MTFKDLDFPVYLLNSPLFLKDSSILKEAGVDFNKMLNQFFEIYNYLAAESCVYLAPTKLQFNTDFLGAGYSGVILEKENTILANDNSEVTHFIEGLGDYRRIQVDYDCLGEANFKYINEGLYLYGYKKPEQKEEIEFLFKTLSTQLVSLELPPRAFSTLSEILFPITSKHILLGNGILGAEEVKTLREKVEVITVDKEYCYSGVCNSVKFFNILFNYSNIADLSSKSEEYRTETKKIRFLEDIVSEFGMELLLFNISEYLKLNIPLSDILMHLNYSSYKVDSI